MSEKQKVIRVISDHLQTLSIEELLMVLRFIYKVKDFREVRV